MKVAIPFLLALLATLGTTDAVITVSPGGGCGSLTQTPDIYYDLSTGKYEVRIWAKIDCDGPYFINVRATDPGDSIKFIYLNATGDGPPATSAGYIVLDIRPASYPSDTIPLLGDVIKTGGDAEFVLNIANVGQIGSSAASPAVIAANQIDTVGVRQSSTITGYTGNVFADISVTSGSELEGLIAGLSCDGNFRGSISATSWIDCIVGGDIGTSSSLTPVIFGNYIANMRADSIYANINGGSSGFIKRIETTVGNMTGSIAAKWLTTTGTGTPGIYIAGDLDADVTITNTAYYPITIGGEFKAGRKFKIGEGLGLNADVTIGSGTGLDGQFIIGYTNPGVQFWAGDVKVGSTTLSTIPYYTQLSSTLGGGAVGLVPFNLHGPDCLPEHNDTVLAPLASARVRHYGPITFSSGMPVKVERQPQTSPPTTTWTDVTAQFDAAISGSNARDLIVTPKSGYAFTAPAKYKITPGYESVDLRCADVTGNPDVHSYEYIFTVQPDVYDFSGGGGFGPEDLAAWLQDPVDINFDEVADEKDWDILMQALEDTGQ